MGTQAGDCAVFRQNLHDLGLLQLQIFLQFQGVLHILLVLPAVSLGPEGVDGGTFAPVQHPVLDTAVIGSHAHLATQGVQLPDQVALAGAADGGIAGHIAHGVQIDGKKNGVQPQPGGSQRRLDPRMARADNGYITLPCVICHNGSSSCKKMRNAEC